MADWFKFYENDIDEMRMQWAIGEHREVISVWIVLLSEACRHKDGTLSGYSQDFELFGISKRINVSVPIINECINLLLKINYLEKLSDGSLKIRKWEDKQSEYCQKKTRLQNQSGDNHHTKLPKKTDIVPIVSGQCPESVRQEERRGDKIREEYSVEFEMFWKLYPKKASKGNAYNEWKKIKPSQELIETIMASLSKQAPSWKDLTYVKHPERWLKARCWEDEISSSKVISQRSSASEYLERMKNHE